MTRLEKIEYTDIDSNQLELYGITEEQENEIAESTANLVTIEKEGSPITKLTITFKGGSLIWITQKH